MSNINVTIRMDEDLKKEADALFAELGVNLSTAFNIFVRQAVREQSIPFMITKHTPNAETLAAIERYPTMGTDNFSLKEGEISWSMIEVIPAAALFNHNIESWSGKIFRVNFYKCGDNLPNPHFLSWNKIDFPRPNFHLPEFFGEVSFDE